MKNKNFYIYLYYFVFLMASAALMYITISMVSLLRSHNLSEYIIPEFLFMRPYLTYGIPVFTLILLVLSNVILKRTRIGKYFFLTMIFYIGFTIVQYMFVNEQFLWFRGAVEIIEGGLSENYVAAIFFIFVVSNLIILNYFIAKRIFLSKYGR